MTKFISKGSTFFEPGRLKGMLDEVMDTGKDLGNNRLTTAALERISIVLGHVARDYDIYDLLFNQLNTRIKVDGSEVNTKDLAALVIMDHEFQRAFFWKPNASATSDRIMNRSVPLALRGARYVFNKSYMSWYNESQETIECDIFLPKGLAGTTVITEDGSPGSTGEYGLIHFLKKDLPVFSLDVIQEIRDALGPTYASRSKPRVLRNNEITDGYVETWNKSTHLIRCLIAQTWIYHGACRHVDQINNLENWDEMSKTADRFEGLKPKEKLKFGGL